MRRFNIGASTSQTPARQLSGGNIQKVLLARELSSRPLVLVASSPTSGLDVGATDTVRGLLTGAAIGDHAIAAVAWSIGIAVVAYLWAIRLYNRRRAAEPK